MEIQHDELGLHHQIRMVLIEDYRLSRIGLKMILEADPDIHVVGEAKYGHQALSLIQELKPDLVMLDLSLQDMDGLELIRCIRKINAHTKVFILTSHDSEESVISALLCGANGYCLKDIISERLLEVVKSVSDGALWLDPRVASRAMKVFAISADQQAAKGRYALTKTEREVLRLVVEGMNNAEIANALSLTLYTAKAHIYSILQKLSVQDRTQAAVKAVQHSLV